MWGQISAVPLTSYKIVSKTLKPLGLVFFFFYCKMVIIMIFPKSAVWNKSTDGWFKCLSHSLVQNKMLLKKALAIIFKVGLR